MRKERSKRLIALTLVAAVLVPCRIVFESPVVLSFITVVTVGVATAPEAEAYRRRRYYRRTPRSYTKRSATDRPSGMEQLQKWQKEAEEKEKQRRADEDKALKKLAPLGIVFDLPSNTERIVHNTFTYFNPPGTKHFYYCYYYDGRPVFVRAMNGSDGMPTGRPDFPQFLLDN